MIMPIVCPSPLTFAFTASATLCITSRKGSKEIPNAFSIARPRKPKINFPVLIGWKILLNTFRIGDVMTSTVFRSILNGNVITCLAATYVAFARPFPKVAKGFTTKALAADTIGSVIFVVILLPMKFKILPIRFFKPPSILPTAIVIGCTAYSSVPRISYLNVIMASVARAPICLFNGLRSWACIILLS